MNDAGMDLLKSFEGCRLVAYQDQVGVWTIGYGHTGEDVYEDLTITQAQADALLVEDLEEREAAVRSMVTVELTDNQFSALVDLVYNIGIDALRTSFLLECVNVKNWAAAADQFLRWDHAGGKVVAGLLRRVDAERLLFLT